MGKGTMERERSRRPMRLKGWDYRTPGAYFVTICTHRRACLFGEIAGDAMQLNEHGDIAAICWEAIPAHYAMAQIDEFVIMPNHMHGIVFILPSEMDDGHDMVVGARHAVPLHASPGDDAGRFGQPDPESLSTIIRSYKSFVTRRINQHRHTPGACVWQRGYYDHIIRDDVNLGAVRRYIRDNPLQWALDRENPAAPASLHEAPAWHI